MANTSRFPLPDIEEMARKSGFAFWEIETDSWSDGLLAAFMNQFYAGDPVVGVVPERIAVSAHQAAFDVFVNGVREDTFAAGAEIAGALRETGAAAIAAPAALLKAAPTLLIVIAAVAVGAFILVKG